MEIQAQRDDSPQPMGPYGLEGENRVPGTGNSKTVVA